MPNVSSEILEKSRFLVGCWLLAAGCYWRWLLATGYVHLLRALAHVLDTHWCHPRKTQFFVLLAAALLPLRLLLLRLLGKTQFFDRFCCWRLLAVKQVRKNHLPGGKTPGLWRTSECQNHAKKVPNVSSEILEKFRFLVGCWLLAAGCYWRWLLATGYVHLLRALAHVLDTHWCHPRKTQFLVLLAAALLPLRLLLLRLLVSAAAYWCLLLPAAACCCLRRPAASCWCCCWWLLLLWCCCRAAAIKQLPKQETTAAAAAAAAALLRALAHKPQNCTPKMPNVTSETHRTWWFWLLFPPAAAAAPAPKLVWNPRKS